MEQSQINHLNQIMRKLFYIFLIVNLPLAVTVSQNTEINLYLDWESEPSLVQFFGNQELYVWKFEGAESHPTLPEFPVYSNRIRLNQPSVARFNIIKQYTSEIDLSKSTFKDSIPTNLDIWYKSEKDRGQNFLSFGFLPIYKDGSRYFRVDSMQLSIELTPDQSIQSRSGGFKANSVLRDGTFYKMAVYQTGIHRIGYSDLSDIGINPEDIDPKNIKIYGHSGGMVPEPNDAERVDDLEEMSIFISGESDGKFDQDDYIILYAVGPDRLEMDPETKTLQLTKNVYSTASYLFITATGSAGKRIINQPNGSPGSYVTSTFDDYIRYEEDRVNIGEVSQFTSGGGKNWYGDLYRNQRERSYNNIFTFPGLVTSQPVRVKAEFIGRCPSSNRFFLDVNGQTLQSNLIFSTNIGDADSDYAKTGVISDQVNATSEQLSATIRYPDVQNQFCEGWLDYIEMQAKRQIIFNGTPFIFRDFDSADAGSVTYNISGSNSAKIWDITDVFSPIDRGFEGNGNNITMHINEPPALRQFIIFTDNSNLPKPQPMGLVENQNLHSLQRADMIVIYHEQFAQESKRLADHRRNFTGLVVEEVNIEQIYNEFSGGALDPGGIRDFVRMLYERDPNFKYLLLFGDASYDYRNILSEEGQSQNFVPTWQTSNSLNPISTFPTDDFYGLLDPQEGGNLAGAVDIAIGRLPANTERNASIMVDKIIGYESDPSSFGDWRLRITFSADDADGNRHITDSDLIATESAAKHPLFNQDKIYLDAYPRVITPGGARFPAAKEAINQNMFKGHLIFNYLGHGGATGLAQERIMTLEDITSWTNRDKLTLFITATCTFAPFDDPNRTSAGEQTMLVEDGGTVGLLTTTRAVFATSNRRLTQSVYNTIFERINGEYPLLGEVLRLSKNATSADTSQANARKFILLGDPGMRLALPKYNVSTLSINGKPIDPATPDTLKATGKYTITGMVTDINGQLLENFSGTVNPTIYDKPVTLSSLGQSSGSNARNFTLQRNIIFKGAATVTNGLFSFTFIMPKDINYEIGPGKISYYAHDGYLDDAGGYDFNVLVGGTAKGNNITDSPPMVDLYMNSEDFAFGGITDANPILYAKLEAANGINFTGNSVGHDLTAIIDDDESNSIILNDFYESELDDFTKGVVRFPLKDLEPGPHNIRLKAWDVVNRSAEGYLEFVVVDNENFTIKNLYNYPNPFNRHTTIQFEHNNSFAPMDVQVLIYTVSGRMVKSMEKRIVPTDFLIRDIDWNGQDNYGQRLANGVYLYKVKVSIESPDGSRTVKESDFQKMVILN